MRILFVITRGDTSGGAQRHVIDMAEALSADGDLVQVVCGAGSVVPDALEKLGIECVSLPFFNRSFGRQPVSDLRTLLAIRRTIRGFRPDLVSTHSVKAGVLGRLAARLCGIPCLYTAHGWSVFTQVSPRIRGVGERIERALSGWSERVIDVSCDGHRFSESIGIHPSKLVTIHNGSKEPELPQVADHQHRQVVTITMVGRLDHPKDADSLIRAIALVPRARLQLVGDGPRLGELSELAVAEGCRGRIEFLGRRDDIDGILAASDIFCLSSKSEGFPRSVLEAMRAGLPTVVTDVGGSAEAVDEHQTGLVFEPGDVVRLSVILAELVDDWELRARLGSAARVKFLEQFTFETMYAKTRNLYGEILGAG